MIMMMVMMVMVMIMMMLMLRTGWETLGQFWSVPVEELVSSWDKIIGSYGGGGENYLASAFE